MRPLIAANWKMHGDQSWQDKSAEFDRILPDENRRDIDVLICPPFPFISGLGAQVETTKVMVGGQNCHSEKSGAFTGEVSADMLVSAGATYVIVGHSERRAMGETSEQVKAKAEAAIQAGLTPIICVGETIDERLAGLARALVGDQIAASSPDSQDIVIAYEPIWAIGTGETASVDDIAHMHAAIREIVGEDIRILYGGSVKPGNAEAILGTPNVNGALIGGASLEMDSLAAIAQAAIDTLE